MYFYQSVAMAQPVDTLAHLFSVPVRIRGGSAAISGIPGRTASERASYLIKEQMEFGLGWSKWWLGLYVLYRTYMP